MDARFLMCQTPEPSGSNWNLEVLVFRGGENGVPREKLLVAEKRTNNKLNPHMITSSPTIEPWVTLVRDECSHQCTIPAPQESFENHSFTQALRLCLVISSLLSTCMLYYGIIKF